MRKINFIIILALVLLLCGCADDQYIIEKQYWKVKKQAESIFRNPDASPPNELDRVANLLRKFIQKYPKNILAIDAEFNIPSLYLVKKEYDKAREQLDSVISRYKVPEIKSQAVFLMGNSYQLQDNWTKALEQYKKIILEYPLTKRGIEVPIYIAQYYKSKFQPDKMMTAFQEAISHYTALADKYPNSALALQSYTLISSCYGAMKNWQLAIQTLNTAIEKFKSKIKMDGLLMNIALIYKKELNDVAKAKETLQRLIKEYPDSKLVKTAQMFLEQVK
jgi:TolA-binding protein